MHTVGGLQDYYNCLDWFYNHILFSFPVPIELEQGKVQQNYRNEKLTRNWKLKNNLADHC